MVENCDRNGFLVVFKPSGCTSRDVVNRVSKILHTKKIGHTGTLDPFATGILILTIGKYTRLSDYITSVYKEYVTEAVLGYETDTLDYTGKTTLESDKMPTRKEIEKAILKFKGHYLQEVPLYSAVKIDGQKLYEYARKGMPIELPKREVEIKDIDILAIEDDTFKIHCTVSKGTYIRSLVRDIGRELGTYATVTSLERTSSAGFTKSDSYTLEDIEAGHYKLLDLSDVLQDLEEVTLDIDMYKKVANGVKLVLDKTSEYLKFVYDQKPVALYKKEDDCYKMFIKF